MNLTDRPVYVTHPFTLPVRPAALAGANYSSCKLPHRPRVRLVRIDCHLWAIGLWDMRARVRLGCHRPCHLNHPSRPTRRQLNEPLVCILRLVSPLQCTTLPSPHSPSYPNPTLPAGKCDSTASSETPISLQLTLLVATLQFTQNSTEMRSWPPAGISMSV